jgi:nitroreductase
MSDVRIPAAHIDPMFLDRWSPRAFSSEPISADLLDSLFEAARWAPSSFNEQPWLFVYAATEADVRRLRPLLVEKNRQWVDKAPVLAVLLARRHFASNGKPNRHYAFDAGAAWLCLALQARKLGLFAHAMAGFDESRTYQALGLSRDHYEAMAMIAIGRYGDLSRLPTELADRDKPNGRKPPCEVAIGVSALAGPKTE